MSTPKIFLFDFFLLTGHADLLVWFFCLCSCFAFFGLSFWIWRTFSCLWWDLLLCLEIVDFRGISARCAQKCVYA